MVEPQCTDPLEKWVKKLASISNSACLLEVLALPLPVENNTLMGKTRETIIERYNSIIRGLLYYFGFFDTFSIIRVVIVKLNSKAWCFIRLALLHNRGFLKTLDMKTIL